MTSLEASRRMVLGFSDPLQLLQTKSYDYSLINRQSGAAVLLAASVRQDFIAELTFHRGAISAWLQSLSAAAATPSSSNPGSGALALIVPDAVVDGLAALAARLHGLMDLVGATPAAAGPGAPEGTASAAVAAKADGGDGGGAASPSVAFAAAATAGWLRSEWTSALSSKPQRFLRLDSLPQELAMIYTAYAAALRQQAHQRLGESLGDSGAAADAGPVGSGGSASGEGGSASASLQATLTAAVGAMRRAAGVYGYLADTLLPELAQAATAGAERPLELLPSAARAMQQLCLAEAQALVAVAAAAKGMSPGTQRALHAGAVSLFRQAQDAAAELAAAAPPGLPLSDRLPRVLAVSGNLQAARCCVCLALDRQKAMELGEAEASCEEGGRLLEGALRRLDRLDPPAWAESIKAQQSGCATLLAEVNKDRLAVTYQALPKQPPDATTNAAVRAAADAFQPAPVVPPRPPAVEANKQGCIVM